MSSTEPPQPTPPEPPQNVAVPEPPKANVPPPLPPVTPSVGATAASPRPMTPIFAPPPDEIPRRRIFRFTATLVIALVFTATMMLFFWKKPRRGDQDIVTAEKFADGLRYGTEKSPLEPGKSGYVVAYDLLTQKKQDEVSFADFVGTFDDLVAEHNLLQAVKRIDRESGRVSNRNLFFHLIYSGTKGEPEIVEMSIVIVPVGREYRVADFKIREPGAPK